MPAALLAGVACLLTSLPLPAFDTEREDVRAFLDAMGERHGLDRNYVRTVLADGRSQQKILDAISRPAEKVKPWSEYRAIFITPERIAAGEKFWAEHRDRLARISRDTGVPAEYIAAIVGVETYFGRITGSYRVVDALGTLAFDYPPRSKFFRSELEQLFLLARDERLDINTLVGSYAGAMGPPQFIPSSYRAYAVDGDGDGQRDLLNSWDDILASIANYFVEHGWEPGEPVVAAGSLEPGSPAPDGANSLKLSDTVASLQRRGVVAPIGIGGQTPALLVSLDGAQGPEYWIGFKNFYVITRYNRSVMYALAVHQLGEALAQNVAVARVTEAGR
jgi:membrane-bound lytic murein transglycosylase B